MLPGVIEVLQGFVERDISLGLQHATRIFLYSKSPQTSMRRETAVCCILKSSSSRTNNRSIVLTKDCMQAPRSL